MAIPILIICYNNYKYVENMINQLEKFNYNNNINIIIINNNSNCKYTINFLNKLNYQKINLNENNGHNAWQNKEIFDNLPDKFIVTDPDLKFNNLLPYNYIDILINLSEKYRLERIGFSLDISDPDLMFPYKFSDYKQEWHYIPTICESQKQYWQSKVTDNDYELYLSPIDTTFHLFNKKYRFGQHMRIAGNFTCKHLPWYINIDFISRFQRYIMYNGSNESSSIKYFEMQYIKDNNISVVDKNKEFFLIDENNYNKSLFWREKLDKWEPDLFFILDKYLNKKKQFLNIGNYDYGFTALYASRYSKYVVTVINDKNNEDLSNLYKMNYCDIKIDIENNDKNVNSLINKYKLNNLSIINVNLNGLEEEILEEYYNYCSKNGIPLLVKFNYNGWKDKDIDRFKFLNVYQREKIFNYPECYIFF